MAGKLRTAKHPRRLPDMSPEATHSRRIKRKKPLGRYERSFHRSLARLAVDVLKEMESETPPVEEPLERYEREVKAEQYEDWRKEQLQERNWDSIDHMAPSHLRPPRFPMRNGIRK